MSLLKTSELTGFLDKVLKQNGQLRTGQNLKYNCPFCNHHKRKLELCLDVPYYWNCWTCHTKGRGFFTLLKKLNAPQSWYSELEKIVGEQRGSVEKLDFDKPLISFDGPVEKDDPELELPVEFLSLTINDGSRSYRQALNYARRRKITGADIVKYNIGYCATGPYRDRLVFPSYDKENKLNFFSCRSYYDEGFKYMNSPFSKNIIGFENMVDFDYPIYLSEGALDAISLKRNAIPLFGKTLSRLLKTTIIESKCPEVNIVLDDDALKSSL
jgi:transcription elongation factor Elf1